MNQFYFVDILFSSANKNQFFSLLCMSNTFKKLYKSNSNYTCSLPPFVFCFQSCSVKHLVGTNDNYRVRTWHSDTVKLTGEFSYKWRRWEHLLGVKSSQFYIYRANSQQKLFHDTYYILGFIYDSTFPLMNKHSSNSGEKTLTSSLLPTLVISKASTGNKV